MQPNIATDLTRNESKSNSGVFQIAAPDNSLHRNFGLDLARAVAISLVLASHFSHKSLDSLGFWGVELFFALSGFLIGQILWRNFSNTSEWTSARIANFWKRRWWRTLPNYYLFFIILLALAYLNNENIPSLGKLSKFLWFGQCLLNRDWGFYSVSWSLCIEEWFYLLFPITLFIFSKITHNHKTTFLLSLLFILSGSIIVRNILINQEPLTNLRGITFARLDAIAYGVLIAFITLVSKITPKQRIICLTIGVVFQICAVIDAYKMGLAHTISSQLFLIIVPLGFALIIPAINKIASPSKKYSVITSGIESISLWSYSIYLSHAPLMWFAYSLLDKYRATFYGNFFSKVFGLTLTLIASSILYKFFEVPFTKMRPKELK